MSEIPFQNHSNAALNLKKIHKRLMKKKKKKRKFVYLTLKYIPWNRLYGLNNAHFP